MSTSKELENTLFVCKGAGDGFCLIVVFLVIFLVCFYSKLSERQEIASPPWEMASLAYGLSYVTGMSYFNSM